MIDRSIKGVNLRNRTIAVSLHCGCFGDSKIMQISQQKWTCRETALRRYNFRTASRFRMEVLRQLYEPKRYFKIVIVWQPYGTCNTDMKRLKSKSFMRASIFIILSSWLHHVSTCTCTLLINNNVFIRAYYDLMWRFLLCIAWFS